MPEWIDIPTTALPPTLKPAPLVPAEAVADIPIPEPAVTLKLESTLRLLSVSPIDPLTIFVESPAPLSLPRAPLPEIPAPTPTPTDPVIPEADIETPFYVD